MPNRDAEISHPTPPPLPCIPRTLHRQNPASYPYAHLLKRAKTGTSGTNVQVAAHTVLHKVKLFFSITTTTTITHLIHLHPPSSIHPSTSPAMNLLTTLSFTSTLLLPLFLSSATASMINQDTCVATGTLRIQSYCAYEQHATSCDISCSAEDVRGGRWEGDRG
ncbi:hypothetical protein GMOD_00009997 [Pyrenophora seminiperda CCB06]|uniref:Uncharacterized protein n=1 Tax=Pyrenophora seminiperda CCB06 TaxID=1302712 RepID=A0A3M7M1M9_9PLEO|nr:hypothetical protein GMOD_00009997 [Pyrenophora seminiperda CCB06]